MPMAEHRPHTVMDTEALAVAGAYAEALMGLCPGMDDARRFCDELDAVMELLWGDDDFRRLLTASQLSRSARLSLVQRVFGGRVSEPMEGLLTVLARRDRIGLLPAVKERFHRQLDARQGLVPVDVTTATEVDEASRRSMAEAMGRAMGHEVAMTVHVDERILGGLIVRVGDRRIDASLARRLENLKAAAAGTPRMRETRT